MRLALFLQGIAPGTLLCWMSAARSDSSSFESLLQQADAVRSADTTRFLALLKELDAQADQATELQRQHLRYLHTYRMALAGDFDSAIADLRRLFDETEDPTRNFAQAPSWSTILRRRVNLPRASPMPSARWTCCRKCPIGDAPDRPGRRCGTLQPGWRVRAGLAPGGVDPGGADHRVHPLHGRVLVCLEALFNQGDLAIDDEAISEQIKRCAEQGEKLVAEFSRGYQARRLAAQGRHAEAVTLLRTHLPEVEATRYPRLIGEICSLLAEYELEGAKLPAPRRMHAEPSSKVARSNSRCHW